MSAGAPIDRGLDWKLLISDGRTLRARVHRTSASACADLFDPPCGEVVEASATARVADDWEVTLSFDLVTGDEHASAVRLTDAAGSGRVTSTGFAPASHVADMRREAARLLPIVLRVATVWSGVTVPVTARTSS